MSQRYPHVFSPFAIKGVELRNRIVRTSQGTGLTLGGMVTDDVIAWHVARAKGGVALGYTDPGEVHWSSPAFLKNTSDAVIDGLRRMTDAVHEHGMKMFEQLMHGGPTNMPQDGSSPWGASAIPDPGLGMVSRPMTQCMIDEVIEGFAGAARRAKDGGIDGIEVHAGHGYLFSAFMDPAINHRTDDYGGTFENRVRLLHETLRAIRAAVGDDYVVGVRLSPDGAQGHATGADIEQVALDLEAKGLVDFVNLSLGSHYGRDLLMGGVHEPPGYQLKTTGDIAAKITLPTIVTGRMATVADAETVLASGVADLIGMLRATIADPEIVLKAMDGRERETRPCIACNQACAGGLNTRGKVTCTVNPAAGRELKYGDDSLASANPRRVLVIGGGPAGVEAARAAAIAGHEVSLLESSDGLGGQLKLIGHTPLRKEVADLIPYYVDALDRLGVDVRLNTRADQPMIEALRPDAVIVATGSRPRRDGFQTWRPWDPPEGFGSVDILTGWDVLNGAATGKTVVLLDEIGHYESTDVAEALVQRGAAVHYVTRFSAIAANLEMRWEMIGAVHARLLLQSEFELHTRTLIHALRPGAATVAPIEAPQRVREIAADTFVFLSGNVGDADLYEQLRPSTFETRLVGDAVGPRLLEAATFEGNLAIRSLEPGWVRPAGLRFGQTGSAI